MQRILIIDDDESIRRAIRRLLLVAGFLVQVAVNGAEGMRQFLGGQFELVIVDIWMPEMDGLETLMEIRRNTPEAKVIVMSGGGGGMEPTSQLKRAKELGAVATLTKPFPLCDLLQAVQEATEGRVWAAGEVLNSRRIRSPRIEL